MIPVEKVSCLQQKAVFSATKFVPVATTAQPPPPDLAFHRHCRQVHISAPAAVEPSANPAASTPSPAQKAAPPG